MSHHDPPLDPQDPDIQEFIEIIANSLRRKILKERERDSLCSGAKAQTDKQCDGR